MNLNSEAIINDIINDITDRRGLKTAWGRIPPENVELIESDWSIIISETHGNHELLVDSIITDFSKRYGISYEWFSIEDDIKDEIRQEWLSIVKEHTLVTQ